MTRNKTVPREIADWAYTAVEGDTIIDGDGQKWRRGSKVNGTHGVVGVRLINAAQRVDPELTFDSIKLERVDD